MIKHFYWKLAPRFKRGLLKLLSQINLLNKLNFTLTLSINSIPFRIPIQKGIGYQNAFMTEMWMVDVLKLLLPLKPGTFLDVGANIGQSLLKMRSVSTSLPYLGLEPNPVCAAYLSGLIQANRFGQTTLIPVGLHNTHAILDLHFFAEGNSVDSGATLVTDAAFRPHHPIVFRQPVPVFPYSDVVPFLNGAALGVIKIDVEGGEVEVLESLTDVIKNERCPILLEILPMDRLEDTLSKNARIEAFFIDQAYSLYRIEKDGERFTRFSAIRNIGSNTDPLGWDYLAIPSELALT